MTGTTYARISGKQSTRAKDGVIHMIALKSHSHIEEFNEWFDEHGERANKCAWKECHCAK